MKIAIIGTGNVGGALASAWSASGHEVVLGTREPDSTAVAELLEGLSGAARAASIADAVAAAEVVVLAVPWSAVQAVLDAARGAAGKILVDCTNPLTADFSALTVGHDDSGGEQVAGWAPGARVVKAFNTTGAANMANSRYAAATPWMPVCADDDDAKRVVMALAQDIGFEPIDAGPLRNARLTEPLAMLWIHLAFSGMGTDIALALLRR